MVKPAQIPARTTGAATLESPVEWRVSTAPVGYERAVSDMSARADAIADGSAGECIWLLEHPPLYTAGTSAKDGDLLDVGRFPVYPTGRGGQFTYHGPGQRVAYVMLDLRRRKRDVRAYVCALEDWIIAALAAFGVAGERREGRVGVWVSRPGSGPGREDKIAAIGVRVRRWVTFHGVSINVAPDLEHYAGIVPCGVTGHGVTSLKALGIDVTLDDFDTVLKREFAKIFTERRQANPAHQSVDLTSNPAGTPPPS